MIADNNLAVLWVTPKDDGDIGLGESRTQEFLVVEFTHHLEIRSGRRFESTQTILPIFNEPKIPACISYSF